MLIDGKLISNQIKEELTKQNIKINVYLGNEIFINNEIYDLIADLTVGRIL